MAAIDVPVAARFSVWGWLREAALVTLCYATYAWVRDQVGAVADSHDVLAATTNGVSIVHLERALGLFREEAVQQWTLRDPELMRALDSFWSYGYLVVTMAVIVWLLVRHPQHFPLLRTAFFVATLAAVAVFALFPTVPPRFLPSGYGMVDTWQTVGGIAATHPPKIESISDAYASMPSLHVAWSVWCATAIGRASERRWARRAAWSYPLLTVYAVIASGNHFFLDCVAGALLMGVSLKLVAVLAPVFAPLPAAVRSIVFRRHPSPTAGT